MNIEKVINPYGISKREIDKPYNSNIESLMIKEPWNKSIEEYIINNKIKGLYLNYTKGWKCDDYSFLENLLELELLDIIDIPTKSLKYISNLKKIKELSINCDFNDEIDFSNLINLQDLFIYYKKQLKSVFNCRSLKKLYICNINKDEIKVISNLENLEWLTINSSNIENLSSIEDNKKLLILELFNCKKLKDIRALENKNLLLLSIDGSKKINDFNAISSLYDLLVLNLDNVGNINTIDFFENLKNLKAFSFSGVDTIINDGNLEPLTKLEKLSMLMFASRKHYSHKLIKKWNWENYNNPDSLLTKNKI